MRCAPALLKVSTVQLAPSSERPAATQSVLPSVGATKPSSETDIFRTSEAMRCFLPGDGRHERLESMMMQSSSERSPRGSGPPSFENHEPRLTLNAEIRPVTHCGAFVRRSRIHRRACKRVRLSFERGL